MSKQSIGIGSVANDGTGDPLRTAFNKVNLNDTELYKALHPGYIASNWYFPVMQGVVFNVGAAQTTNTMHLALGYVADKITLNTLGCRITTLSAGGNLQLAIYAHSAATGRPTGTALASTASISTAATGALSSAISVQLDVGWYWWAINADNSVVVVATGAANNLEMGSYTGSTTQAGIVGSAGTLSTLTFAQTFNTWPDLTGQSFTETNSSNLGPLLQFKVASIP